MRGLLADSKKEKKFEDSLSRLEKIVDEMEEGKVSLDDSLKKYEEAVGLIRFCQSKLTEAERKIEILQKDQQGNYKAKNFDEQSLDEKNKGVGEPTLF